MREQTGDQGSKGGGPFAASGLKVRLLHIQKRKWAYSGRFVAAGSAQDLPAPQSRKREG